MSREHSSHQFSTQKPSHELLNPPAHGRSLPSRHPPTGQPDQRLPQIRSESIVPLCSNAQPIRKVTVSRTITLRSKCHLQQCSIDEPSSLPAGRFRQIVSVPALPDTRLVSCRLLFRDSPPRRNTDGLLFAVVTGNHCHFSRRYQDARLALAHWWNGTSRYGLPTTADGFHRSLSRPSSLEKANTITLFTITHGRHSQL